MIPFLLRRLGAGLVLVFVIATVTFFLTSLTGSDPARRIAGTQASLAQVAAKRHELGLDRPVLERYVDWLSHAVRGDFGTSWFSNQPVDRLLGQALPVS